MSDIFTERQERAIKNIRYATDWHIGELENTLEDCEETDPFYISAKKALDNHDELVREIYTSAINTVYDEGFCSYNKKQNAHFIQDIRFCGKEFLMNEVEKAVKAAGY